MKQKTMDTILSSCKIKDNFWSPLQELVISTVIPYQEQILNDNVEGAEKSHGIANFKIAAGLEDGEYYGMVFQDSDVAKWLEAAAYSLMVKEDKELETRVDNLIDILEKAQQKDGYLNTYFTIKEPDKRWINLQEGHELYCAGHFMEAAVAYYQATGKDKFLKIMERNAKHIATMFGEDKEPGIPGHQEVEIGLMRLFHTTGNQEYKKLASYFIDERGQNPEYFYQESQRRNWEHFGLNSKDQKYAQCFAPVREQKTAEGHSVRAVYMYTAMADIAKETGDESLIDACNTLWDNMVNKRMYVTGGIGSTVEGEAFTLDYDLPNDTVYAETCASIGLAFFARNMLNIKPSNKYSDIMELAIYNGVLSGMQQDGKNFFYVNPLEVNPGVSGELHGFKHVLPQRPKWYACACCPPNVARLIPSLGKYAVAEDGNTIYCHLYIGGEYNLTIGKLVVESSYPWEGKVNYKVTPSNGVGINFAIRVPGWAKNVSINSAYTLKDGYAYITCSQDSEIEFKFDMPVKRVYSNSLVRTNSGKVALKRGPLVYCLEGIDNGNVLQSVRIPRVDFNYRAKQVNNNLGSYIEIEVDGFKAKTSTQLYSEEPPVLEPVKLKAIPYYKWGNRGLNQMSVWIPEI